MPEGERRHMDRLLVGLGTIGTGDPEPVARVTDKNPVVTVPKASNERHPRANFVAADLELDTDGIAAIDAVERAVELLPE